MTVETEQAATVATVSALWSPVPSPLLDRLTHGLVLALWSRADPDGHAWGIVHDPGWPVDANGSIRMQ